MDVVGHDLDGNPITSDMIAGSVMGDVMGVGSEEVGRRRAGGGHRLARIPQRPQWRNQLAPGVIQPDEGMVPLTLTGQSGSPAGTFGAATQTITFQGQLQKPFRAERLLCSTVRTGASAVGRLLTTLYVGTDLQQAEITGWDAELVGAATAFGTRLTCKAAEPGVFIRAVVTLSSALTGTDTIFANLTFMGRIIH
jgi:hypothetical protein